MPFNVCAGRARNRCRASVLGRSRRARPTGGRRGCSGGGTQREVDARELAGDDRASVLGDGCRARTPSPCRVFPSIPSSSSNEPASTSLPAHGVRTASSTCTRRTTSLVRIQWLAPGRISPPSRPSGRHTLHALGACRPRRPETSRVYGADRRRRTHRERSAPARRPRCGAPVGDQTGRNAG